MYGLTMRKLGSIAGVSASALVWWEKDKVVPNVQQLYRLAFVYYVTPFDLLMVPLGDDSKFIELVKKHPRPRSYLDSFPPELRQDVMKRITRKELFSDSQLDMFRSDNKKDKDLF